MARNIEWMHRYYGKKHCYKCRDCCNYLRLSRYGKAYRKCTAWGDTHGPGTDWTGSWDACGLYNTPYDPRVHKLGTNMKQRSARGCDDTQPLEGQIAMAFD